MRPPTTNTDEHEHIASEGIVAELVLHQGSQGVEALAHVGHRTGDEDPPARFKAQHDYAFVVMARTTSRNKAESKPGRTRITASPTTISTWEVGVGVVVPTTT
jgi:hypothetical protein